MIDVINALGARETTVTVFKEFVIEDDLVIPANITLLFLQGGSLDVANAKTVTINGYVVSDPLQIFTGAGTVVVNTYPQQDAWWGLAQEFNFGAASIIAGNMVDLPGAIADILTDHNKAAHDALLITDLGVGALAKDHGAAATDMIVNVCYGVGAPPAANTTTEGTLFIKYA